ncbi:MAG: hypothetical protein V4662_25075 [Verrucomicrobiota bacterium]
MTWSQLSEVLEKLVRLYSVQWRCKIPTPGSQIPPEIELAADAWSLGLAKNLMIEEVPHPEVAPWLLLRFLCAQALANGLAEQGDADCPSLDPKTMERLLMDEWHGALKHRWHLLEVPPWLH